MKHDFHIDMNLMQLSETLEQKEPYAVLVVSTTGIDKPDCDKHSPTRVQLVQFEFDDEIMQYTRSIEFDKLVAADKEAVAYAIAHKDDYDALGLAGIDAESYQKQVENPDSSAEFPEAQRVLTQEEFKKQFSYAMTALQHDNTTLIVNGTEHSQKYLEKIGCSQQLDVMVNNGRTIDQPKLGGEYLKEKGLTDLVKYNSATLENVRNALTPVPPAAKKFDTPDLAKDYGDLSKEDFLKNHPDITERTYNIKTKDVEMRASKASASERVNIINNLVTAYGREIGQLESQQMMERRLQEKQRTDILSENGKKKYQNDSLDKKVATQIEMGVLDKDAVLRGDSQYQKLMEALSGENGKKGIAFVHVATSGMNTPRGNATGLPMQIYIRTVPTDAEGKGLDITQSKSYNFYMKLPNSVVLEAERQASSGKFDVFKDAGIDVEKYKEGVVVSATGKKQPVLEESQFVDYVEKIFTKVNPDDYEIIALSQKGDKAFFQKALESVCNSPIVSAPTIDVIKAFSEYALLTSEGVVPENKIFSETSEVKGFGIRDVAEALDISLQHGTSDKVNAAFIAVSDMYEQYLELTKEEREQKAEKTAPEVPKSSPASPASPTSPVNDFVEVDEIDVPVAPEFDERDNNPVPEPDFTEPDEEFNFADEDGFDGETYVEDDGFYFDEPDEPVGNFDDNFAYYNSPDASEENETPSNSGADISVPASETPKPVEEPKTEKPAPVHRDRPERLRPQKPQKSEPTEPTEPTVQQNVPVQPVASVPVMNNDFLAIIMEQQKTIQQQNALIMEQNSTILRLSEINAEQSKQIARADERLFDALQQSNQVMQEVVRMAFTPSPVVNHPKNITQESELDNASKLEQIKESLDAISKEVSPKASMYLREAYASVSDGQQEMENPTRPPERPI